MAAFQWPIGKLEIINAALSQTGDNLLAVLDDGSVESNVCSPAYETALAFVCEDHGWSWLTEWRTLSPSPIAPSDTQFDTAYDLPDDLVHLIMVRIADRPCVWGLLNGQLVVNSQGGPPPPVPPAVPAVVTIKGIFSTNSDIVNGTPTVVVALQRFVMSAIYRAIRKDVAEAGRMSAEGMGILERAKTRHDQQLPKRSMFNSRILASRRIRRPWPPVPTGWGGSGIPG